MSNIVTPKEIARLHLQGAKSDVEQVFTNTPQDVRTLAQIIRILIRCIEIQDKEIEELKKELQQ